MKPSPTHRATFSIGNEAAARRVVDVLTEVFLEGDAAVAAFERPDGQWDVTLHFAEAPDQALLREIIATSAGNDIAANLAFDTVEAKDWVKASLEDLVPVPAGRFVVHGSHDRDRVAPNKLAIEIEAALAFGTGHHGTTRGCLLLLDHVLKQARPERVLDLGTGTGVLGIAAAKSLHLRVLASDIDPPSVRVAAENAALNQAGDPRHRLRRAGFCQKRPVRPGAGQHPGQSAPAIGRPDGAASCTLRACHSLRSAEPSGPRRDRRLPRAWPGAAPASADRGLEQLVAAEDGVRRIHG